MNTMKKRIFSLFLALVLLCTLLPQVSLFASAESYSGTCGAEGDGSNLTWTFDADTGVLTIEGSGTMQDYSYYDHAPWREYYNTIQTVSLPEGLLNIGSEAFWCSYALTSVTIPDSVTSIGSSAFAHCSALSSVTIPDGVSTIGGGCFSQCSALREITLPAALKTILSDSFWGVGLENVTIPEGVEKIESHAFYLCPQLQSIHLPASLQEIGTSALACAERLEQITVADGNPRYCVVDSVLFDQQASSLLCFPAASERTDYAVPDGTVKIDSEAFSYAKTLKHIFLPDSLRVIGYASFSNSGVTSVNFPEGLEKIEDFAFSHATALKDVVLPESIQKIENNAFEYCSALERIVLPNTISVMQRNVFLYCDALQEIVVKNPDCYFHGRNLITDSTVIVGHDGSTAQIYAENYGKSFCSLETGEQIDYHLTNAEFLALLPTEGVHADGFVSANVSSYDYSGRFIGYDGVILKELDTENPTFQEILNTSAEITANCSTDYEKARAIQEWTTGHLTYVYALVVGNTMASVYSVWNNRCGNCMAFALMNNFLLWTAGIPSATVHVYGHEFSAALVDGRWIAIDASSGRFDFDPNDYDLITDISFASDNLVFIVESREGVFLTGAGNRYDDLIPTEPLLVPDFVDGVYGAYLGIGGELNAGMIGPIRSPAYAFAQSYYPYVYRRGSTFYAFKTAEEMPTPFEDVAADAYYAEAVDWAVENNVTAGIDETRFAPNLRCTREQIVTFLWAANGKPEPEGTAAAFSDVSADAWYYKAVEWAVEQGFASGMGDGSFGVGRTCTRAEAMTFLWASKGRPEPESTLSPFSDVSSDDWCCSAVLWAAEQGVTAGISDGLFGVSNSCTRAQIITFLFKAYATLN
jgi:hypothetical protein